MRNNQDDSTVKTGLLQTLRCIFPLSVKACPFLFVSSNFLGLLSGLLVGVQTTVTAMFFTAVSGMVLGGSLEHAIWSGILLVATVIVKEIVNGIMNTQYGLAAKKTHAHFSVSLHEKARHLDPIAFENSKLLTCMEQAEKGIAESAEFMSILLGLVTIYLPYLAYMSIYLYSLTPLLVLSMVFLFVPVVCNQIIRSVVFSDMEDRVAPVRRRTGYFRSCVIDKEYSRETRTLGAYNFFHSKFVNCLKEQLNISWKAEKKTQFFGLLMSSITLLAYGGVLFLLTLYLLKGKIGVGDFAAVFSSLGMIFGIMNEVVQWQISSMTKSFSAVRQFAAFFNLPERPLKKSPMKNASITLQDVSFSYPNRSENAVNHINLAIRPGESIAIVGANGAGKTTLTKLLSGVYRPTSGRILIGDVDTAQSEVAGGISSVFQQYQRYQMTLADNISIGDWSLPIGNADIQNAASQAGVTQAQEVFPNGLDTMLSREFDGVELSGGQWQRIAIARGLYRAHEIIVLDEPTASIDPMEESRLYHKFAEISHGKTSILVTHRMGSARIADRIIVMDHGCVVQDGRHEDLVAVDGVYKRLWMTQAKGYQEKTELEELTQ